MLAASSVDGSHYLFCPKAKRLYSILEAVCRLASMQHENFDRKLRKCSRSMHYIYMYHRSHSAMAKIISQFPNQFGQSAECQSVYIGYGIVSFLAKDKD